MFISWQIKEKNEIFFPFIYKLSFLLNLIELFLFFITTEFFNKLEKKKKILLTNMYSKHILLNNGFKMPKIGLGTAQLPNPEQFVYLALKKGMRLIDTASIYKKEKEIGTGINRAIKEGIVKREEIFLVSKLWVSEKDNVIGAVANQLADFNLDYIDLYLDHWPMQIFHRNDQEIKVPAHKVWEQMETLVKFSLVKSIGVSNYNVQRMHDLLSYANIPPTTLQVEMNPYFQQKTLKSFCLQNSISLMAYNSLCNESYVQSLIRVLKNIF